MFTGGYYIALPHVTTRYLKLRSTTVCAIINSGLSSGPRSLCRRSRRHTVYNT
jgi:hypothetical protein